MYKLFSDKEMPGAGELAQIKAYDYPKFALKDIGERFSQAAKQEILTALQTHIYWYRAVVKTMSI